MIAYRLEPKIIVSPISEKILSDILIGEEILVLVSKSVWTSFHLEEVFKPLYKNRKLHIYDHIRPDAPFDDLDRIIEELKDITPTSIVAIGGGSVIDAGKALSVAFQGICYKDIFYGKSPLPSKKIPVIAIPTTAGTGAELSFGAIIYDKVNSVKGGIRGELIQPNMVLLDARLHQGCPIKLKAEVGFDSLTHAVETYISKKSNPVVKYQSINSINTILKHLVPACENNDFNSMQKVAISSTLMGLNLAYSSTCLPHRIQYVIGPMTGTSHAQGLIALYKGWIYHLVNQNIKEFVELSKDLQLTPESFAEKIISLKEKLKINYSLSDLGLETHQAEFISSKVSGNLAADPSYEDINSIKHILNNSF